MTTTRAEPKQHPCRCVLSCDSCNHAEKTNSPSYPFKCLVSKPVPMMVHEYCTGWFGYVGCFSHSANTDAQARIDAVVKELEIMEQQANSADVAYAYSDAIALLKGDVHNG